MGEVYKTTDTRLDRTVAIKVLPEHLAASPERKARFEREAKAISQFNRRHIGTLDVECTNDVDLSGLRLVMNQSGARSRSAEFYLAKGCAELIELVPMDQ